MKKDYTDAMNEYTEAEKPGLWENIKKKKEREGKKYKPAKPGDPDRPDPEAYKKAQSSWNLNLTMGMGSVIIIEYEGHHVGVLLL